MPAVDNLSIESRWGLSNDWKVSLRIRCGLVGVVFLSFGLCSLIAAFVTGLWNTPFSTTDSLGRTMGFNDNLSFQHYAIALSNFSFSKFSSIDFLYTWVLLTAHVIGLGMLATKRDRKEIQTKLYFRIQLFLFPVGWIGMFVLPMLAAETANQSLDREGVIDIPFIALTAQPFWLICSVLVLVAINWSEKENRFG